MNSYVILLFEIFFWVAVAVVFYTYFGYALVLKLIHLIKSGKSQPFSTPTALPRVALVVAAYNEESQLEEKIRNTYELDYPADLLELIFVTDGSTDQSVRILLDHPRFSVLHEPQRKGKVAAANRAINYVQSEIIIFSDANSMLNKDAVKNIVRHYQFPKTGGVAGEKRVKHTASSDGALVGEGFYWRYESWLKKLDSQVLTTVGAAGELFSIRKALYEPLPEDILIEDFVQSMKLCEKGYVVKYEPEAYAEESPSASIREEMKRKVRITAGAFQAMTILKPLFNVFRHPLLSFMFISHRILRWTLCPLSLLIILLSGTVCYIYKVHPVYELAFWFQVIFYSFSLLGWTLAGGRFRIRLFHFPFYFVFMNLSVFVGFYRYIRKRQSVLWERSARQLSP